MSDSAPPRRRFQFRLRTLLVGVTLLCVWCGYVSWKAKTVLSRRATLQKITLVDKGEYRIRDSDSWLGRMLGDKTVEGIIVPSDTSLEERRSLRAEFPELHWGIVRRVGSEHDLEEFPDDPNPR
jgi:hypothetical protein